MTELNPIVVAEDDADDLYLLTRRIRGAGIDNPLVSFSDANSAIAYFGRGLQSGDESAGPCALFTDLKIPPATGFELIAWVKAQPRLRNMKLIVISGSEDPVHRRRAEELNVDFYALKFPPADELKRIFFELCAQCRRPCGRDRPPG